MRFQSQRSNWDCGPTVFQHLMALLGRPITRRQSIQFIGASKNGSDEVGVRMGMSVLGVENNEFATSSKRNAWKYLQDRRLGMLAVDNDSHWVLFMGIVGAHALIFDPDKVDGGVLFLNKLQICKRWKNTEDMFYGIFV